MVDLKKYEFWFVTGSQHLYGPEALEQVAGHSNIMAEALDKDPAIAGRVVFKPVVTTLEEIRRVCEDANHDANCAGIITWMHTFSPSKMWISGLSILNKPLLHLHTQFNRDIPWDGIDMDFMNLNQSAHGDREHGYIGARMRLQRKIVVGHWEDNDVRGHIGAWMRAAIGCAESRSLRVARFGDNMREVAVTEGDKVDAQIKLGWSVNGYGIGELVKLVNQVSEQEANKLLEEYKELYIIDEDILKDSGKMDSIREQAKIELALKAFLQEGGFGAFTTTFEDLHGLKQLPGLAVQRMMEAGYGFGGEGDWKTSALLRIMKVMAAGLEKGTSFMEDYTYHLENGREMILGAHMLEVCPSIAANRPKIDVHPLGIGNREDPARMVFDGNVGAAVAASLIDMGDRFRLIVNEVEAVKQPHAMPKLPVARTLWKPLPSLKEAAQAWILAGGAHHTSFSFDLTMEHMEDWAEMMNIEYLPIDANTNIHSFKNELRWNDLVWRLR
ncbi:MAG: L-arabinose isomerase [Clostridiaceae bacterium]|nr:L-arabinose isomerase [Clostridiaceae bacterium]